jgi:hypothetical protein
MPALARALMQGRGFWAGVRKPPREETAGRKLRRRGEAPPYEDFAMGRASGCAVEGAFFAADESGGGVRDRRSTGQPLKKPTTYESEIC